MNRKCHFVQLYSTQLTAAVQCRKMLGEKKKEQLLSLKSF